MGLMGVIVGTVLFINQQKFVAQSKVIPGTVKDLRAGYINNRKSYFPVIQYFDEHESKNRRFESDAGFNFSRYNVGDKVELRYLRVGGKRKLSLNTFFALWGAAFLFMSIGLLFSTIGLLIIVLT